MKMMMNNEEFIKDYLDKLAKSIQGQIDAIKNISWNHPHVIIKLGELTQSMRTANDSCLDFYSYLVELTEDMPNIAHREPNGEEKSGEDANN